MQLPTPKTMILCAILAFAPQFAAALQVGQTNVYDAATNSFVPVAKITDALGKVIGTYKIGENGLSRAILFSASELQKWAATVANVDAGDMTPAPAAPASSPVAVEEEDLSACEIDPSSSDCEITEEDGDGDVDEGGGMMCPPNCIIILPPPPPCMIMPMMCSAKEQSLVFLPPEDQDGTDSAE